METTTVAEMCNMETAIIRLANYSDGYQWLMSQSNMSAREFTS